MSDLTRRSQFLIYQAESGTIKIDVRFEDETVWLSQQLMAELFQTTKQNVSLHLKKIYDEGELRSEATVKEYLTVQTEGAREVERRVVVAKNYLNEPELAALNNLVEQYLVFAEGQAMRRIPMRMHDWIAKLDGFLTLNERGILKHAGKVSHELAQSHAETQYEMFHQRRQLEEANTSDDFDRAIAKLPAAAAQARKTRKEL